MRLTLPVRRDGEWHAPARRGYLLQCCDCGLVHRVDFRIRRGLLQMRAFRLTQRQARRLTREVVKLTRTIAAGKRLIAATKRALARIAR